MRHKHEGRKLGKTAEHRNAMLGNMVTSLIRSERIFTTIPKAKEAKKLIEHLITQARRGNAAAAGGEEARRLALRRQIARTVHDPEILRKLFDEIAPRYVDRPGGYTRILRLATMRVGDSAQKAILELLKKDEEGRKKKKTPRKTYHKFDMPSAPVIVKPVEVEAPAAEAPAAEAPTGEAAQAAPAAAPGSAAPAAHAPAAHAPAAKPAHAAHKAEAPKKEKTHKAEAEKPAAEKKAKAKAPESKEAKPKAKKE
jgi:large subunit ribosomal protein L17